jgi:hypothetical protein
LSLMFDVIVARGREDFAISSTPFVYYRRGGRTEPTTRNQFEAVHELSDIEVHKSFSASFLKTKIETDFWHLVTQAHAEKWTDLSVKIALGETKSNNDVRIIAEVYAEKGQIAQFRSIGWAYEIDFKLLGSIGDKPWPPERKQGDTPSFIERPSAYQPAAYLLDESS